jgi:hypothetical protein
MASMIYQCFGGYNTSSIGYVMLLAIATLASLRLPNEVPGYAPGQYL